MKKTKSQMQKEMQDGYELKFNMIMALLGSEKMFRFIIDLFKKEISSCDDEIKREIHYYTNESDAYRSQKADARKLVKKLKADNQKRKNMLKKMEKMSSDFFKLKESLI
jgi:hypothetical protein